MGYQLLTTDLDKVLLSLSEEYDVYAPKLFEGDGCFSDIDVVRYRKINFLNEIVFDQKSDYSFKEILTPISETLFYFTEDEAIVPKERKKGAVVFLRACDLNALKRLDDIYLHNGAEDFYYKRLRENTKFILMECKESFETCFCVSMGTNKADNYDAYISVKYGKAYIDCKWDKLTDLIKKEKNEQTDVQPEFVKENNVKVAVPQEITNEVYDFDLWKEYNERCIACGRCNFVCPTCTCFTMQDIFYKDNKNTGERRRVWASCHIDGYTEMAGNISFRKTKGERMRFKVLHKVHDFKKRFGYNMCTGCGRCDQVCPEYISFSNCINKLNQKIEEVK